VTIMSGRTINDIASAARSLTETATRTLATCDGHGLTEPVLRLYRDDARTVVVAVLRDLAGGPAGKGVVIPPRVGEIRLSELADAIERGVDE
jgi:hypothetical protein